MALVKECSEGLLRPRSRRCGGRPRFGNRRRLGTRWWNGGRRQGLSLPPQPPPPPPPEEGGCSLLNFFVVCGKHAGTPPTPSKRGSKHKPRFCMNFCLENVDPVVFPPPPGIKDAACKSRLTHDRGRKHWGRLGRGKGPGRGGPHKGRYPLGAWRHGPAGRWGRKQDQKEGGGK